MLGRIRSEFQYLQKWGQNSNASKDKVRIPIFTKMGAEFQCKEGYGQSCNVHKNRARIPVLERTRQEFQCVPK